MLSLVMLCAALVPAARVVEVEIVPSARPQIAIWVEDAAGRFVDTVMVTRLVGTYGLGNRPGRSDMGTGHHWPYGRREMALPVWAHRRGVEYDRLVFTDCHESAIRFHNAVSSEDPFYCRPTTAGEHMVDAQERFSQRPGQRLGGAGSYQQRPDETRPDADGDRVELVE